jgi:hypothetical protein
MSEQHKYTNRLIKEKSPYLIQHSHNPVDWYPWGEEAFNAAKEQDKPIFLSIGYATCHWCHVMERESFENEEIAKLLNDAFINIKVDREELPHVDSLYMEFAQSMMSGSAGWPLNVILTPELQPFFSATYLPPHTSHGLMGVKELISRIQEVWKGEERERILEQAEKIVEVFAENVHLQGNELPVKEDIEDAADLLFKMSDPVHGGLKGAPKFPIGYQYSFLMHFYATNKDSRALFMVERTLDMMQRGGIFDHLGGGFARYAVDEQWLVPHFEKMLYDNAILISTYLEAWKLTKKELYKEICEETIRYILRDMTHPEGGFYSAEDADSEGFEGFFYTWTYDEIIQLLGDEPSALFRAYYGIKPEGNFHNRNILHITERLEIFAAQHHRSVEELKALFQSQKDILWKTRERRPHPFKDDKILSSWNGLMIHALASAGKAFDKPEYVQAAVKAAKFIRANMWEEGRLLRRWREGEALLNAGIDEYAYMIHGLLTLFETRQGTEWLSWAIEMTQILATHFKSEDGAFYQTDEKEVHVILRKTHFSDGAEPSGNAIHCENLLRLYQMTANPSYLDQAEDILRAVKKFLDSYPPGYCYHLRNLCYYFDKKGATLSCAVNKKEEHLAEIERAFFTSFIPHNSIIWPSEKDQELHKLIPYTADQKPLENKTTLYICHDGYCEHPLTEIKDIRDAIT